MLQTMNWPSCLRVLPTAFLSFIAVPAALAAPAAPGIHSQTQPDGTTFAARLHGDEFFNYYTTADGHPLTYDPDSKWWTYASTAEEGVGPSTGLRPGLDDPPAGAWTPKTPTSELEARKTREYEASVPPVNRSRARGGGVTPTVANVAMLLTTFSDRVSATDPSRPIYSAANFESLFFSTADENAFTAANLFRKMSYGLHTITSGPAGIQNWTTATKTHDYYGAGVSAVPNVREGGARVRELVRERVTAADGTMDFGPYDTNNDGFVDLVCVIYQGTGQANSGLVNDIWPIRWTLGADTSAGGTGSYQSTDVNSNGVAVKINDFIVIPELNPGATSPMTTIGLFAHEYGHGIGWPDLYDSDSSSSGLGNWCLMGSGCYNRKTSAGVSGDCPSWANAWCRMKCGWLAPANLTNNQQGYRLPEAKRENAALRLWRNGQPGSEYFLVENRERTGWDQGLPGGSTGPAGGLLIWHIDDAQTTNANDWWLIPGTGGLTNAGHRWVALEQADQQFHLDRLAPTSTTPGNPGNAGDGGDMFTPGGSFTDTTVPSSRDYSGTATNVAVRNIQPAAPDASIAADFFVNADQGFPEILTMDPADGQTYYVVNSLSGTTRDNVGVGSVRVALQRHSPAGDEWYAWGPGAWQAGAFNAAAHEATPALSGAGTTRTFNAGIPAGHVTPASYSFFAKAFDTSLAGTPWRESRFTVLDDPNGPDVTIGEPSNAENYAPGVVPNFQGSAIRTSGTIKVEVAMKMESGPAAGRFYDWTTNTFSPAGVYGAPNAYLDDRTTWVVNMAPRPLGEGGYTLFARVTNGDLRVSPWRAVAFRVGRPFRVIVSRPAHLSAVQQLTEISGTVDDPSGTGLANGGVRLTMTDSDGRYWNGTAWQAAAATFTAPAGAGGSWVFSTMPPTSDLPGGDYTLAASATNNSGESTTPTTGVNSILFRVDRSLPVVAISAPADGAVINTAGLPVFSGTATDASGIAWVNCFLRRNADQAFWTGVDWTRELTGAPDGDLPDYAPPVAYLTASYNAAAGTWQCSSPLPSPGHTMKSGSYNFIVMAGDTAGNYVQRDAAVTVDYHATYTWTGHTLRDGINGNDSTHWDNAANWSPYGVPGEDDIAVIANGDRVDSALSRTVYGLQLANGTLNFTTADRTLTTTGNSTWTGGTMTGIWENQGIVTVSGPGPKLLWDDTVWNNFGTIVWTGDGPIQARAYTNTTSVLNNKPGAVFRIAGAGSVFSREYGNRRPVFNNENGARLERDGTGGFATLSVWEFQNAGEIRAQTGILSFQDGAFDGYDLFLNPGTTLTGAAYLRINNATQLNTAVHAQCSVEMVDGSWLGCPAGAGVARFEGTLNWWGGVISGDLTIGSAGVLNITDPVPATAIPKVLWDSTTVNNDGTINWTGGAPLRARAYSDGTAVVNNRSGAFFNLTADGTPFAREYGNRVPVLNNEAGGTFRKTGGTGTALVNTFHFNHRGSMACEAGVLAFDTTLNVSSPVPWSGAGDFEMQGGYTIVSGTMALNGPAFTITAGEVWGAEDGSGAFTTTGGSTIEWKGGLFWRTMGLTAGSRMNLSGPNPKVLWDDTTLNNDGTITWQGGGPLRARAYTNATAVVNNRSGARFEAGADGDVFAREYHNRTPLFNNLPGATFARAAGDGTATVHSFTFNNDGTITADTGVLAFNTTLNLRDAGTMSGAGRFEMPGGVVNVSGATLLTGTSFSVLGGDIVGLGGAVWNTASAGAWRWLGGTLSGTLELGAASLLQIADPPTGTAVKVLWDSTVLNNRGTITWAGASPMRARAYSDVEAVINNKPGATFRLESDGPAFTREYSNRLPRFSNEAGARFDKPAGNPAVETLCDWRFNNAGTLDVNGGRFDLLQGGDSSGTFRAGAGAFLRFRGGSHTLRHGTTLTGTGNIQVHGGTVIGDGTVNGNTAAPGAFDLVTGTLGGTTNYTGPGLFHWTGGTVADTLTLAAGTRTELDGPAAKILADSATVNNSGTMLWMGGGLIQATAYTNGTAVINNRSGGIFRLTADGSVFTREYSNRRPLFNNNNGALFEKQSGGGSSVCSIWEFHNAGEIRCGTGTLAFMDGPYDGYDLFLEPGTTLTGSGRLRLQNATHLTAAVHAQCPVDLPDSSWLGCPPPAAGGAVSQFEGTMNWTGGVIWGELIIGPAGILNIADAAADTIPKVLWDSTTLHNDGTINWSGGGPIRARAYSDGTATVNNRSGAFFNATADGMPFAREYNNRQPVFNNLAGGTFRKVAGSGTTLVDTFTFNHRGGMVCDAGVLAFHTTLDVSSATPWTGAGDFEMQGGVTIVSGTMTLDGPSYTLTAGDVWGAEDGSGTLATTGGSTVEWKSGAFWRTLTLSAGSTMNLSGPAIKVLWDDTTLNNEGTIVWQGGGPLRARAYTNTTAVLNNRAGALFHATVDGEALTREYGNRTPVFNNEGIFRPGSPVAAVSFNGWQFNQSATGTMQVDVGGAAAGEFDAFSVLNGTATLAGTLSVSKLNGYAPAAGTTFAFLTAGTLTGTFGLVTGGFAADYTSTSATLRAVAAGLPFDDWAASKGLTGPNALPGSDPDNDGYSNFFEYVHNMNPAAASGPPENAGTTTIDGQQFLTLHYRRYTDREAAGVTYTPQTGSSLGDWGTAGIIEELDPDAPVIPGSTACRCRVPIAGGDEKFLRVKAQKP